ncbi:hypothetical protein F5Y10DRAFT_267226 [Nemania abortiva]|nr:hypothetical protein F5Y10DRAFT_267226 [Nemania abortiva]
MDGNWEQDRLEQTDLAGLIVFIHLIACPNPHDASMPGLSPTNHWSLFFEISGERSVRLDMVAGFGRDGQLGRIEIASKGYVCTTERVYKLSYKPARPISVEEIVQLIQRHGRQHYRFAPEGEGCRHWYCVFIQDLETAGILYPGSAELAQLTLSSYYRYPSGSGSDMRGMKAGSF